MKAALIKVSPLIAGTNTRVDVYVGDGSAADMGTGGIVWEPAIIQRPALSIELFSPDLDGKVQAGKMSVQISTALIRNLANPAKLYWSGAPVTMIDDRQRIEFIGYVDSVSYEDDSGKISLECLVSVKLLDKPLLSLTFTGGGGLAGDPGKRGAFLPAGFGVVNNIEPVFFDETYNIGMIDGYANTLEISWLGEGLSSLGASRGDFPTYAALKAAIIAKTIPPGGWGTCIAYGLVGLGAPPVGRITVRARFGYGTAGTMLQRIFVTHAGIIVPQIDTAAFAAVDASLAAMLVGQGKIHFWTAEQRQVQDLVEAVARSINATVLFTFAGKISITRAAFTAPIATLDLTGGNVPRVLNWKSAQPQPPVYLMSARAARPAAVFAYTDVNYNDTLVDRGAWNIDEIYRDGNLVQYNGSTWLYTNPVPTSGHVPPSPAYSDAYWQGFAMVGAKGAQGLNGSINQVVLSSFAQGLRGFLPGARDLPALVPGDAGGPAGHFLADINYPGYFGVRQVPYGHFYDNLPVGATCDVFWTASPWSGYTLDATKGYLMTVKQGDRIYARCLAAQHRCRFDLYVLFFSATGAYVEAKLFTGARDFGGQGGDPSNFNEIGGVFDVTHPDAKFAGLLFRMTGLGQADPYIFFTEPAMGQLPADQAIIPPYVNGPNDPLADITALSQESMTQPDKVVIQADYQGNQVPGQFPIQIGIVRRVGGTNVSRDTTYNVGFGGNVQGNINNVAGSGDRGLLTLTGPTVGAANGTVTVTSGYRESYKTIQFSVETNYAPAPVSGGTMPPAGGGGTGGGPSTVSTFIPPSTNTAYVLMATLSGVTVGSAGSIMVSASLSFAQQVRRTAAVATNLRARVTRVINGGTEAEITTQLSQEPAAKYLEGNEPGNPNGGTVQSDPGSLTLSYNDAGITASAVVVYRIYGIAELAANGVNNVQGTFAATPN